MPKRKLASLLSPLDHRQRISLTEAARRTGYTVQQLRNYSKTGDFPAKQIAPGKRWFVSREDFEEWEKNFNEVNAKRT